MSAPQHTAAARADTDWIEWNGGKCPVPPSSFVAIQLRCEPDRGDHGIHTAGRLVWEDRNSGGDIIAYRVVAA